MKIKDDTLIAVSGIAGAAIFFSMMFYALSTPSQRPSLAQEVNTCNSSSYEHIKGYLSVPDQETLLIACSQAIYGNRK